MARLMQLVFHVLATELVSVRYVTARLRSGILIRGLAPYYRLQEWTVRSV